MVAVGTYRWWTENPPLPKVVTAFIPYLAGMRLPARPTVLDTPPWTVGIELLDAAPSYQHALMLARLGTVLFLIPRHVAALPFARAMTGSPASAVVRTD